MTWTAPFTASTSDVMASTAWNVGARDNLLHLRALTGDPTAANQLLVSTSTAGASFAHPSADAVLAAGSVTGTSTASAISTGVIAADRFAAGSFDATGVAHAFSTGVITQSLLAAAVQNKLIFSGLVGMVRTAAEIPSGWTRESALDGRFAIGAGTSLSETFDEATDYGSSWGHAHALGNHTHPFSVTSGAPDTEQTQMGNSGEDIASNTHTHTQTGTSGTPSAASSTTAWQIPTRAYVFLRRD